MASSFVRSFLLAATVLTAAGCQSSALVKAINPPTTGRGMAMLQAQAQVAAEQHVRDAGVAMAEARVQASPADLEARRTLAQVYLASGRFRSAAQAYDDAMALAPQDEALRLKKALALLGQGNSVAAIGELDRIRDLPDAGLAYALAGQAERGVDLLTRAARAPDATPRVRQNLALALALDGQWARAKVVAGQDLDPAGVDMRMRQWAMLAASADPAVQTAGVLAVAADASDPGRPIGLAYVAPPARMPEQVAAAEPPRVIAVPPPPARVATARVARISAAVPTATGVQWVVQLGAYDRPELVESNWQRLRRRSGDLLAGYEPTRSEKLVGDRRYYRLSIAGFDRRAAAVDLCEALQAKGRDCFVRRVGRSLPPPTRA